MNEDRWKAEIFWRTNQAVPEVITFEEFDELGAIIERGPNWNDIHHITITLQRRA